MSVAASAASGAAALPTAVVRWAPSYRLVPSRFPAQGLFDRVSDPADLEAVFAIEALTNDRLRQEAGQISLVPPEDRVTGPGTTPIMAAFTHPNPLGSRFSSGAYGVYYAARELETAVAETRFHRERFLALTAEPPIEIDMRSYAADLDGELHDLRGGAGDPAWLDPEPARYGPAQALASQLRRAGSGGLIYPSVRRRGGECVAVFRPRLLGPARQGKHFCFRWDGFAITHVYTKQLYRPRAAR